MYKQHSVLIKMFPSSLIPGCTFVDLTPHSRSNMRNQMWWRTATAQNVQNGFSLLSFHTMAEFFSLKKPRMMMAFMDQPAWGSVFPMATDNEPVWGLTGSVTGRLKCSRAFPTALSYKATGNGFPVSSYWHAGRHDCSLAWVGSICLGHNS